MTSFLFIFIKINDVTTFISGVDVASNSALNQTAGSASLEAGKDLPFRRQHFDRNSVLRHSKKRRKSSSAGSTTTSPIKPTLASSASPVPKSSEAEQPLLPSERGRKRSLQG